MYSFCIAQDNPVRVIDAFVNRFDLEELDIQRAIPNVTCRPSYAPRDLIKFYVYGNFNRIRSSRQLMAECRRNVELFYLLG
jgi:transposase